MSRSEQGQPSASSDGILQNATEKLEASLEALMDIETHYAEKRRVMAHTDHALRIKRAVSFKLAEGTADYRKAVAEVESDAEMQAHFIADAESDIAFAKLLDARLVASCQQSILSAESKRAY